MEGLIVDPYDKGINYEEGDPVSQNLTLKNVGTDVEENI